MRIGRLIDVLRRACDRFQPALEEATGSDAYELERRLGQQSQRYIKRYTNPPEDIAADHVEHL